MLKPYFAKGCKPELLDGIKHRSIATNTKVWPEVVSVDAYGQPCKDAVSLLKANVEDHAA